MSKPNEPPPAYPNYPPAPGPYGGPSGPYPPPPPPVGNYNMQQPQVYPPGPGGYPGQVTVIPGAVFREHPVNTVCPHCGASVVTQVRLDTGTLQWLLCGVLFFVGCSAGCCLIPFCIDNLKDATHSCPMCQRVVGHYKHM